VKSRKEEVRRWGMSDSDFLSSDHEREIENDCKKNISCSKIRRWADVLIKESGQQRWHEIESREGRDFIVPFWIKSLAIELGLRYVEDLILTKIEIIYEI
jgi:hypothetical protein